jgi:PAS domain S-box-containing protein
VNVAIPALDDKLDRDVSYIDMASQGERFMQNVEPSQGLIGFGRESSPRQSGHPYLTALAVFLGYYAGAKLGFELTALPNPIAVLWAPNAILFAVLLVTATSRWWIVVAAALAAHLLAELQVGVPPEMVALWFVSNVSEGMIGALCMRRWVPHPLAFNRLQTVLAFVLAAITACVVSSFIDSAFVKVIGWGSRTYWELWQSRIFSNLLASLTLVPAIVALVTGASTSWRALSRARALEFMLLFTGYVVITVIAFDSRLLARVSPALLYVPLPFLAWAALRFGAAATSWLLALFSFLVIWGTVHGLGPFSGRTPDASALSVEIFLICIAPSLLFLSAVVEERESAARELRRSERRFASTFRANPMAMALARRDDARIVDVNARWQTLFGYGAEHAIGRTPTELGLYASLNEGRGIEQRVAMEGRMAYDEISILRNTGEVRQASIMVEPVLIEGDAFVMTSFADITERKSAEENLRMSVERFQLVLVATKGVVCDRDLVTGASWWSHNGLHQFGYEKSDGEPQWATLIHEDDRARVLDQLDFTVGSHAPVWESDYRLRRADGSYAYVHEHGFIGRDASGKVVRFVGALTDVTELRQVSELEQRMAQAARLAAMGELTASIAHEINQPISAILSNVDAAEMLIESGPQHIAELREVLRDIRSDDLRASEVIRHVRGLTTKRQSQIESFDLNEVVSSVVKLVAPGAQRRKIRIYTTFNSLPPVRADRIHVQQVVLNLLLNAQDAMQDTIEPRPAIMISTTLREAGWLEVAVADHGRGLVPAQRDRVFESFYTTKPHGMGLGLSIARSLVEAGGGRIWVDDNPGGGAIFRFTVRAQPNEAQGEAAA